MSVKMYKARKIGGKSRLAALSCSAACGALFLGGYAASALTYQSNVNMSFTINPSLSIGLSAPELVISELAPGASSDSNTITVTVDTNASCGYVLNATVGQATSYETRDLVLSGTEAAFTSLAYGSSLASLTSDNTWGFSYKPSTAGASWTNYSGLPRYDDSTNVTTLISTDAAGETNSVDFKIAARASNEQSAGEYKNVINFVAVANPEPLGLVGAFEAANKTRVNGYFKMQDMNADICAAVDIMDDQMQAVDVRDGKVYWIAKLRDGNCWMTQNLDLDIDANTTYTNLDTDLGYNASTDTYETASWTPIRSTYTAGNYLWCEGGTSSSTACSMNYTPESYDPGEVYWDGTVQDDPLAWYNYFWTCEYANGTHTYECDETSRPANDRLVSTGNEHYHVGNFYNWSAAAAMNDTSGLTFTNGAIVEQSICPRGWTLPRDRFGEDTFYALWQAYGYDTYDYPFEVDENNQMVQDGDAMWKGPLYYSIVRHQAGAFFGGALTAFWSSVLTKNSGLVTYSSIDVQYGISPGLYSSYISDTHAVRCVARPITTEIVFD